MGDELIEGEYTQRWWVQAAPNQDSYQVFVVRYGNGNSSEYLTPDGSWMAYDEYAVIIPTLEINGRLLHILGGPGGPLPRKEFADALQNLCWDIVMKIFSRMDKSNESSDPTI